MNDKTKFPFFLFVTIGVILLVTLCLHTNSMAVLNPKGWIGLQQKDLMIKAAILMLFVVIPVFILTVWFSWKYRSDNTKATYRPNSDKNLLIEAVWWGGPFIIVIILSWLTWEGCLRLDPVRPIESNKKTMNIQVVALQWKWLFIYPDQKIATVNEVHFPENTPILFSITADAPMNSFWIPDLGGQIYAMPGMKTDLYLIANQTGSFRGSSSNLSGDGFAEMVFTAVAESEEDFEKWVEETKNSGASLTLANYQELKEPSVCKSPLFYQLDQEDLYESIVMKYMMPHNP
jgi:cytochrome o ubiquinol oxidase subunit 2